MCLDGEPTVTNRKEIQMYNGLTTEQLAIIGMYAFATVAAVIMLVVTLTVIKAILRIGDRRYAGKTNH